MKGSDAVSRARVILNDADGTRWPDSDFVPWVNDGCAQIAVLKPDSCMVNQNMTLVAGPKQSLTTQNPPGQRLFDVVRNITTGRGITLIDKQTLASADPSWSGRPQSTGVVHYVYDDRDPTTFYVYPPASAGTIVEGKYSRLPVKINTVGELSSLDLTPSDLYIDPLVNYLLHRAYGKDAEYAANAQLSLAYLNAFLSMLGAKAVRDRSYAPTMNDPAARPAPNGAN